MRIVKNPETESFTPQEKDSLVSDLKRFGYLLPTDDDELDEFEQIYGSTQVIFPNNLNNCDFLFDKNQETKLIKKELLKRESLNTKSSLSNGHAQHDYFKKIVLAAEIAYELYMEPTFGHKKFVKVLYLCEQVCNMKLSTCYKKFAAGPLDPKLIYSVDSEFKKQGWFKKVKRTGYGYKYEPLVNVEKFKFYYQRYYGQYTTQISELIELFRKKDSAFCEIVATLYAVWNELIYNEQIVDEESLFSGFYAWDEAKACYKTSQLRIGLTWMIDNNIVPRRSE